MKKIIRTSASVILISAFAAVSGALFASMESEETFEITESASFVRAETDDESPSDVVFTVSHCDTRYILREYNGKIGIFETSDDETPLKTLDVYVFTLPENVSEALKVGIGCDIDELYRYIDSFTS